MGGSSGVDARNWSKSFVFLESNEPLSGGVNGTLGELTWGFAFLKERGLGKSNVAQNGRLFLPLAIPPRVE